MKKLILLFFALSIGITGMMAQQKLGHVNTGNVMEKMPEVGKANEALGKLQDSLTTVLDTLTARFQNKYQKALMAVQEGTLTKIQQSQLEKELQDEQAKITEFQQYSQQAMGLRRQTLITPLLEKLQDAIDAVGKENGFQYIFDVSTGAMLFASESSTDIGPLVEAKLGIKS